MLGKKQYIKIRVFINLKGADSLGMIWSRHAVFSHISDVKSQLHGYSQVVVVVVVTIIIMFAFFTSGLAELVLIFV